MVPLPMEPTVVMPLVNAGSAISIPERRWSGRMTGRSDPVAFPEESTAPDEG
jgi:hypothetical protein